MNKDEVFNFMKTKNISDEDLELLNLWLKDRSKIFFGFLERENFEISNHTYYYRVGIRSNMYYDIIDIQKKGV